MNFKSTLAASALAAAAAMAAPAPGHAQIWIGQIAGEMAAQEAAAAQEKACREGAPAGPKDVAKATEKAGQLLDAYFALTSRSKGSDYGKVFALKAKDTSWKAGGEAVALDQLGARLDEPTPTLQPVSFIVAGDAATARGIWSTAPAGADGKTQFYAVDFTNVPGAIFGSSWRIWHLALFNADSPPATPGAYCHYDPDQAW